MLQFSPIERRAEGGVYAVLKQGFETGIRQTFSMRTTVLVRDNAEDDLDPFEVFLQNLDFSLEICFEKNDFCIAGSV
jgi:hypothetical protein